MNQYKQFNRKPRLAAFDPHVAVKIDPEVMKTLDREAAFEDVDTGHVLHGILCQAALSSLRFEPYDAALDLERREPEESILRLHIRGNRLRGIIRHIAGFQGASMWMSLAISDWAKINMPAISDDEDIPF